MKPITITPDNLHALIRQVEQPILIEEAAEHCRVSARTFRRYISIGYVPSNIIHRVGGGMLFYRSELNEWIKGPKMRIA